MERGAQVIAVTARPIRWLDRLKPCFGRLPHVIASNGAVCYDLAAGGAYDLRAFDLATLPKLLADLRSALPTARSPWRRRAAVYSGSSRGSCSRLPA